MSFYNRGCTSDGVQPFVLPAGGYMEQEEIQIIQKIAEDVLNEQSVKNVAIRDGIFDILEKKCTVLYYPLEDEANMGFHTKRLVKDALEDFVFINTWQPLSNQIFTAAHEMGHIINVAEQVYETLEVKEAERTEKQQEDLTDRFAAELLMPHTTFHNAAVSHLKDIGFDGKSIRVQELLQVMVSLMDDFMVPYEAVRRRLVEVKILTVENGEFLRKHETEILEIVEGLLLQQNTSLTLPTNIRSINNIRDMLASYQKKEGVDISLAKKIESDFQIAPLPEQQAMVDIKIGASDGKN